MPILDSGQIFSEVGTKNPWEDHFFKHQVNYVNPGGFCQHVKWYLSGDIPKGISIDASSGVISGYIKWFDKQPSAKALFTFSTEKIKFDGSNYKNSNRFKHMYFDFHFTIYRDVKILDANGHCTIPLTESSGVFIREIKLHDIDNYDFIHKYLNGEKDKLKRDPMINVNGKVYNKWNVEELKSAHPGPFYIPKH